MSRPRLWLVAAVAVVALVAAALAALPAIVRWLAIRQLADMTGRQATIGDVDLNLFTRRFAVLDLQVPSPGGAPPLVRLERLEGRFRLTSLLRAYVDLERLELVRPAVHVVRTPDGRTTADDVVDRIRARPPAEEPMRVTVDALTVVDGRAVLEDRALEPDRTWSADDIEITGDHLTTEGDARPGRLEATMRLAGAPLHAEATDVALRPLAARVHASLRDLDLAPVAAYLPPGAPITVERAHYSADHALEIAPGGAVTARGDARIADLVLGQPGRDRPLVTAPEIAVAARGVGYADGVLRVGRAEVTSSPSVLDPGLSPPAPRQVRDLRIVAEDVAFPGPDPARVALAAALPAGGRVDATGTATIQPLAADLAVRLAGIDLAEARRYLPRDLPLTVGGGRLAGALDLRYRAPAALRADGTLTLRDFTVRRAGQQPPLIAHPVLEVRLDDLALAAGGVRAGRVRLSGAPTVIDGTVSPPERYRLASLSLTVEDAAWPVRRPARVRGSATLEGGARVQLAGRVDAAALGVDVRAHLADLPLARAGSYLPPDAPVTIGDGLATMDVRLRHTRADGVRIDAAGAVTDLALGGAGQAEPFARDARLAFGVDDLRIARGAVAADRVTLAGAPTVVVPGAEPAARLQLRDLDFTAEDVAWPARRPGRARLVLGLPDAGTLEVDASIDLAARAVAGDLALRGAALAPFEPLLPVGAPVGGLVDVAASGRVDLDGGLRIAARGHAAAHGLRLGPPGGAPVEIERVAAQGLTVDWPASIRAERVEIAEPSVVVQRTEEGRFPLVAMVAGDGRARAEAAAAGDGDSPSATPRTEPAGGGDLAVAVDQIAVTGGSIRYIDETTTPFFSEELSELALSVSGLSTARERPAGVDLQAVLGTEGALELHGVVDPFGRPFFLEVEGELRRFSVPRTNPFLRRLLSWIARSGELTTALHYRIVGRQIEGTNEITVQQLAVERARQDEEVGRVVGLPLALIVSLLKNPQGEINLTIPVSGELGSPEFSFGDAIRTALRNVLSKVVTGPFAAIGRLFRGDGEEAPARLEIEPLEFPAAATLDAEAQRHVQRVADFLRAAPFVAMTLAPVVTASDLAALRSQAAAAEIQRVQRETGAATFDDAARRLFAERLPGQPLPDATPAIVEALAQAAPAPLDAARQLARRRVEATRQALVEQAGIEPQRLQPREEEPAVGAAGAPRVEFALAPATGAADGPTGADSAAHRLLGSRTHMARNDLPRTIQRSPKQAQRTWKKTHDSAVKTYGEGERAHRTAYASLKHSFKKVGDHWVPKERKGPSDPRAKQPRDAARRGKGETFRGVDYYGSTRAELVAQARRQGIRVRSDMTKKDVARALARRGGRAA